MSSIKDEVRIRTTPARAYAALTEQSGYRTWWNKLAEVPQHLGGEPKLLFQMDGQPVAMRYRIDTLAPNERVVWTCIAHDLETWDGTTLDWSIKPAGDDVVVVFEHTGWQGEPPPVVAQGWRHFMGSLKSYLEAGTGQPW